LSLNLLFKVNAVFAGNYLSLNGGDSGKESARNADKKGIPARNKVKLLPIG
jgi:hypothetical protein